MFRRSALIPRYERAAHALHRSGKGTPGNPLPMSRLSSPFPQRRRPYPSLHPLSPSPGLFKHCARKSRARRLYGRAHPARCDPQEWRSPRASTRHAARTKWGNSIQPFPGDGGSLHDPERGIGTLRSGEALAASSGVMSSFRILVPGRPGLSLKTIIFSRLICPPSSQLCSEAGFRPSIQPLM